MSGPLICRVTGIRSLLSAVTAVVEYRDKPGAASGAIGPLHCSVSWIAVAAAGGQMGAAKKWVITVEQTMAGLQGLPQHEARIGDWRRACDKMTDAHMVGEDAQADTDAATQRPYEQCRLILEFTRPNDWCALSRRDTDAH